LTNPLNFQIRIIKVAAKLLALIIAGSTVSLAQFEVPFKPLETTRLEIDNYLNKGIPTDDFLVTYWRKGEKIIVTYSSGMCSGPAPLWDVPRDTVISVYVILEKGVAISYLTNNVRGFEKRSADFDLPGRFAYRNQEEGRGFETDQVAGRELVISYSLFPSAKLSHKRCK
jgi:hypothetical protein